MDRTVLINGVSKTYAMTGWRIGWAAAPLDCAKVVGNIQSQVTSNPNSIAQYATLAALKGTGEEVRAMGAEFEKRRNRIAELVNAVPGLSARLPEGAFYLFVNIQDLLGKRYDGAVVEDSMQMANLLLDKMGVALVPGIAFGMEGYLRLSYALSMEAIEQGVALLAEFAAHME
jgi:aspartate aminotransferase